MKQVRVARLYLDVDEKVKALFIWKENQCKKVVMDTTTDTETRVEQYRELSQFNPVVALNQAIGYLTVHASNHWPIVDIYTDGKFDLIANYRDEQEGKSLYTIGAVFREDSRTYTFHS